MILLDVNVLVYAHRPDADGHDRYRAWLEEAVSAPSSIAIADVVLTGFVRIVTNPRIFARPTPIAQALAVCDDLRGRANCLVLAPGERHWSIFGDLCRRIGARGGDVPDAYLAALAIEGGCELLTADRGFARFPDLRWRHPLD